MDYSVRDIILETAGKAIDNDFFNKVLKGIGTNSTPEKLKFFHAWKRAEDANARFNPLATKWDLQISGQTNANSEGVKAYPTEKDGVRATINTLTRTSGNPYAELVQRLKQSDVTARELAETPNVFRIWNGVPSKQDYVLDMLPDSGDGGTSSNKPTSEETIKFLKDLGAKEYNADGNLIYYLPAILNDKKTYLGFNTDYQIGASGDIKGFKYEIHDGKLYITDRFNTENSYVVEEIDGKIVLLKSSIYINKDNEVIDRNWSAEEVMDWIQIGGDVLGWFFPPVDILNAGIYFYRDKYLEGVLSLIGVIPLIGDSISFSLKVAFKASKQLTTKFGRAIKLNKGDELVEVLTKLQARGYIDHKTLKQLAAAGDEAAQMLLSGSKSTKIPKQVGKYIDNFAERLKTLGNAARKASGVAKSTKAVVGQSKIIHKLFKFSTGAVTGQWIKTFIKGAYKVIDARTVRSLKSVSAVAAKKFKKQLIKNPDLLATIIKTSSHGSKDVFAKMTNRQLVSALRKRAAAFSKSSSDPAIRKLQQEYLDMINKFSDPAILKNSVHYQSYVQKLYANARSLNPFLLANVNSPKLFRLDKILQFGQRTYDGTMAWKDDDPTNINLQLIHMFVSALPEDMESSVRESVRSVDNTVDDIANILGIGASVMNSAGS